MNVNNLDFCLCGMLRTTVCCTGKCEHKGRAVASFTGCGIRSENREKVVHSALYCTYGFAVPKLALRTIMNIFNNYVVVSNYCTFSSNDSVTVMFMLTLPFDRVRSLKISYKSLVLHFNPYFLTCSLSRGHYIFAVLI